MATLHLVSKPSALASCLAVADAEDAVLLLEDGVYAGVIEQTRPVHVLGEDADKRSLTARLASSSQHISYDDFVDLAVEHQPIVNWR